MVSSVFNNTLAHSPFRVTEKLRPKITELCLFGLGTKQTSLLSLNEFNFLILKIAITVCPDCSFTFLSEKIGTLFSSVVILLIGFLTYFRSGFLILIRPLFKSIITSKFRTKSRHRMNWSETSKFSTTRKLIQRSRLPYEGPLLVSFRPRSLLRGWRPPTNLRFVELDLPS